MIQNLLDIFKNDEVSTTQLEQLYYELEFETDLKSCLEKISLWFWENFGITNFIASDFDMHTNIRTTIFQDGKSFYLDDEFCKTFVIQVHSIKNILITIKSPNEENYYQILKNQNLFDAMMFFIAPLIKDLVTKNELFNASYKDNITGFFNRKYLDDYLLEILESGDAQRQTTFMMVDVDRFKAVIDEFDYEIGDRVLIELAKVIQSNISENDYVVKLSGYELLILINGADDDKAAYLAQQIISDFAKSEVVVNMFTGQTLKKTVCIGYSMHPIDHESPVEVIKSADIALQEAKNIARSTALKFKKEIETSVEFF